MADSSEYLEKIKKIGEQIVDYLVKKVDDYPDTIIVDFNVKNSQGPQQSFMNGISIQSSNLCTELCDKHVFSAVETILTVLSEKNPPYSINAVDVTYEKQSDPDDQTHPEITVFRITTVFSDFSA